MVNQLIKINKYPNIAVYGQVLGKMSRERPQKRRINNWEDDCNLMG